MKSDTSIWLRSISWRRWKRGLCVAALTGALTGVVALCLGVELTLQQAVALLALSVAKDCLLFLKQYPVQHTTETTHFIYRHLKLFVLPLVVCLCGCTSFRSHQIKTDPDGTRTESMQVVRTFWDSKSAVAKLRASTTDKTQGLTVGSIDQETTATNAVNIASQLFEALIRASLPKP